MLTEDKVTEIFFMADEFCKFFDRMTKKYNSPECHNDLGLIVIMIEYLI